MVINASVKPLTPREIQKDVRLQAGTEVTARAKLVSNPANLDILIGHNWARASVHGSRTTLVNGQRTKIDTVKWKVGKTLIEKQMPLGFIKTENSKSINSKFASCSRICDPE